MYSIVLCFDPNYQIQAWVLMKSIIEYGLKNEKIHFHLIIENEERILKAAFEQLQSDAVTIQYISLENTHITVINEIYDHLRSDKKAYISRIALAKLFIPIIFTNCEHVLYLDSDMLVVDDIRGLWFHETDKLITVVPDLLLSMSNRNRIIQFTNSDRYFNSGLILFHVKRLKGVYDMEKVKAIYKSGRYFRFIDQDQLNILYKNEAHYTDLSYNLFARFPFRSGERSIDISRLEQHHQARKLLGNDNNMKTILTALANPKIIHFVTQRKPWNTINGFYHDEWRRILNTGNWTKELLRLNVSLGSQIIETKESFCYRFSNANLTGKLKLIVKRILGKD